MKVKDAGFAPNKTTVPRSLILEFLKAVTNELNGFRKTEDGRPASRADIRQVLLTRQRACLERVLDKHKSEQGKYSTSSLSQISRTITPEEVQDELRRLQQQEEGQRQNREEFEVKDAIDKMNESARLSFCCLVLFSEWVKERHNLRGLREQILDLEASKPMQRLELLEFCGLLQAALRLDNVKTYLEKGSPLFDDDIAAASTGDSVERKNKKRDHTNDIPHERLEKLQRMVFRALGYDPDHGMSEIKRVFFSPPGSREARDLSKDEELNGVFQTLLSSMNISVAEANAAATQAIFDDHDEGGVTRVVGVNYTEKTVDPESGKVLSVGDGGVGPEVPTGESMGQQREQEQREKLRVASRAASLQQEILGELFSMHEDDRERKLEEAKEASDEFLLRAMEFPPGAERIQFLQSVDSTTQRLLAMHKLWESMLAANGGKPPTVHRRDFDNE